MSKSLCHISVKKYVSSFSDVQHHRLYLTSTLQHLEMSTYSNNVDLRNKNDKHFKLLVDSKQWDLLLKEFHRKEKLNSKYSQNNIFSIMIAYKHLQQPEKAVELFRSLKSRNMSPSRKLNNLARQLYHRMGQFDKALEVSPSHTQRNPGRYFAAMVAYEKKNNWESIIKLLESMVRLKVQPDTRCFRKAMIACVKVRNYSKIIEFYGHSQDLGGVSDMFVNNLVLNAFVATNQAARAIEHFKETEDRNTVSFNIALKACSCLRDYSLGIEIFESMKETTARPNERTFNQLIICFGNCGEWEKALEFYNLMIDYFLSPSLLSIVLVMSACTKSGAWERALEVYATTENNPSIRNNVLLHNAAITAYDGGGQWENALRLFKSLPSPDIYSLCSVINACGKGGQWELVQQLFNEHKSLRIQPNIPLVNATMFAFINCGKIDLALDLAELIEGFGLVPDEKTFIASMWASGSSGNLEGAERAFKSMIEQGIDPSIKTFETLLHVYEMAQQPEKAVEMIRTMKEYGIAPNQEIFNSAMKTFEDVGKLDQFFKFAALFNKTKFEK